MPSRSREWGRAERVEPDVGGPMRHRESLELSALDDFRRRRARPRVGVLWARGRWTGRWRRCALAVAHHRKNRRALMDTSRERKRFEGLALVALEAWTSRGPLRERQTRRTAARRIAQQTSRSGRGSATARDSALVTRCANRRCADLGEMHPHAPSTAPASRSLRLQHSGKLPRSDGSIRPDLIVMAGGSRRRRREGAARGVPRCAKL